MCPGWLQICSPFFSAFQVAGITGMHYHAWLTILFLRKFSELYKWELLPEKNHLTCFNWLCTLQLFIICHDDFRTVFVAGSFCHRVFWCSAEALQELPKGCQARFSGSYLPGNQIFALGHFIYLTKCPICKRCLIKC